MTSKLILSYMQHAMNSKFLLNENVENSDKIKVVMRLKSMSQSSKIIMDHRFSFLSRGLLKCFKFKDTSWHCIPGRHRTGHSWGSDRHRDQMGLCEHFYPHAPSGNAATSTCRDLTFLCENSLLRSIMNTFSGLWHFSLLHELFRECVPYVFHFLKLLLLVPLEGISHLAYMSVLSSK